MYFDQNDITGQTLFAGTSIGILETTNLRKSWTNLSLNQLPLVQVFSISENADTLTIATHGRGVWQLQIAAEPQANATWSLGVRIPLAPPSSQRLSLSLQKT